MKPFLRGPVWWIRSPIAVGGKSFSLGVRDPSAATARARFLRWVVDCHPEDFPLVQQHLTPAFEAWGRNQYPAWRYAQRAEVENPRLPPLIDQWLQWLPATDGRANYAPYVRRFFADTGITRADEFTHQAVWQWLSTLPHRAPRRVRTALSSFAKFAIVHGVIKHNPTSGLPALPEPSARTTYLTSEQAEEVVMGIPNGPERAYHALALAYPIELSAMFRLAPSSFQREWVRAEGTKNAHRARWCWTTPRWAWAVTVFRAWYADNPFRSPTFSDTTPWKIRQALRKVAPEGYRVHDHRHTWTHAALLDGYSYRDVAQCLGHGDETMVIRVYGRRASMHQPPIHAPTPHGTHNG